MRVDIEKAKASKPREGFIPNPKLKLLDQVSEVMRFKHYSLRTERTYREWIKRFILFHSKRHPREMGVFEVERQFLILLVPFCGPSTLIQGLVVP